MSKISDNKYQAAIGLSQTLCRLGLISIVGHHFLTRDSLEIRVGRYDK